MKRLADEHRVDAAVIDRDGLCGAVSHGDRRQLRTQHPVHLGDRLDSDNTPGHLLQQACELTGTGREIKHNRRRRKGEHTCQQSDCGDRVAGPASLIRLSTGRESCGSAPVYHHGETTAARPLT
jgi:hypothetical protein